MANFLWDIFKTPILTSRAFMDMTDFLGNPTQVFLTLQKDVHLPFHCAVYPSFFNFIAIQILLFIVLPIMFLSMIFVKSIQSYLKLILKIMIVWYVILIVTLSAGPSHFLSPNSEGDILTCITMLFIKGYLPLFSFVAVLTISVKFLHSLYRYKNRNKVYDDIIERHQKPIVTIIREKTEEK